MLSFLFPDVLFLKQFLNFEGRVGTPSPHLLLTLCKHLLACKFRMSGFVACVCVCVCTRAAEEVASGQWSPALSGFNASLFAVLTTISHPDSN